MTNSIQTDIKSNNSFISTNAIRLVPNVLDQIKPQAEDILRKAFIDKNIKFSNSALLAAFTVARTYPEVLKKITNEIQNLITSKPGNFHYHAINTLYLIKKTDQMAFVKILISISKGGANYNNLAIIQIMRLMAEVLESDYVDSSSRSKLYQWISKQLNRSSNAVVHEAAKIMVNMKNITNSELTTVVACLSLYLLSMSSVNVYSTLKIIYNMIQHPARLILLTNTADIELMLNHHNKGVRCLAVCILIKSAKEDKISSLLNKTFDIFAEMPDRTKIEIIESCKSLAKTFPGKVWKILNFLWKCLRDRGEILFKDRTIDVIYKLMKENKNTFDFVLDQFSEYIEDPHGPELILKIMNIFIKELPSSTKPQKYVRYILNRLHLDESSIRSAAISCLGELALKVESLREEIKSILLSFKNDTDNEVRERVAYYIENDMLMDKSKGSVLSANQILEIERFMSNKLDLITGSMDIADIMNFTISEQQSVGDVYLGRSPDQGVKKQNNMVKSEIAKSQQVNTDINKIVGGRDDIDSEFQAMKEWFARHETFGNEEYGDLKKSSVKKNLIDEGAEYYTTVRKHMFENYTVMEFEVKNNDDEHDLTNIDLELNFKSEDLQLAELLTNNYIAKGKSGCLFASIARNPEAEFPIILATFTATLKFTAVLKDADGEIANEYEDEYPFEQVFLFLYK